MRPQRRNRQPSKKVLHAGAKSSNSRRQTRAEIQRKRRVLNHEGRLDVGQRVDLNTTEMDQMPSTSRSRSEHHGNGSDALHFKE
jgi:hypothetical protein